MSGTNDHYMEVKWFEVSKELSAKCKPCPWCGDRMVYVCKWGCVYSVQCTNYHCPRIDVWMFDTPEKAIEDWNRRGQG